MATLSWPWSKAGLRSRASRRGDESLRRVALRLAAQTVGLLLVMLLALEAVVFVITQQSLLGSIDSTLASRAGQWDPTVCNALHAACPPGYQSVPPGNHQGPSRPTPTQSRQGHPQQNQPGQGQPQGAPQQGGGFHGQGSPNPYPPSADVTPSEASVVYVNRQLQVVDAHSIFGSVLLSRAAAQQAISTGKTPGYTEISYEDQEYRVYTRPLLNHNNVVGAVQTSISEHQYLGTVQTLLEALVLVTLLGLAGSSAISAVLVQHALRPIRLAMQRQRDFVADAAHELRTPLAIMRTVGEVGMGEPSADELQATIAQMLGENQHLTRLVEDLSLLARTDTDAVSIDRRPVDLSALVMGTADELRPLAEAQDVTLQSNVTGNIWVLGDILRLRQLLLILLDNALKHTPAGGTVRVHLYTQGDRARLQVTDSGPGIDPRDLTRIFDRFYRSDRARTGEGSGLGLAIGKWIVGAHGGQIQAGNVMPHGAIFTVSLPLARAAASS